MTTLLRTRFATHATVLLAAALGAATVTTATTVATASAPSASTFVPITPCRLVDTRPGDINVGPRATPLGAAETMSIDTWGTNGNCTLPTGATALSMNIVSIEPTASSFLTVFPADATRPTASSLNWTAGQAPTPNSVTAALSTTGQLAMFNLAGTVHLAVDVVGYYAPPGIGATGPAGATGAVGPSGPPGEAGVEPANEIWVAESGGDFTTVTAALASITDASPTNPYVIRIAPGVFVEATGVMMKAHVDLVGSGDVSVIRSSTASGAIRSTSVAFELRDLSVENTAGLGIAINNTSAPTTEVRLVDVRVSSTSTATVSAAVQVLDGVLDVDGLRATAAGGSSGVSALSVIDATVTGRDLVMAVSSATASVCTTIYFGSSTVTLDGVHATSDDCTQVSRTLDISSSTATLTDVTLHATAVSSQFSVGLGNDESNVTIDGMVATADGAGALGIALNVQGNSAVQVVRNAQLRGVLYSAQELTGNTHIFDTVFDGATNSLSGKCTNAFTTTLTSFTCS